MALPTARKRQRPTPSTAAPMGSKPTPSPMMRGEPKSLINPMPVSRQVSAVLA